MSRTLGQLSDEEREQIVARIQQEAQDAAWHGLTNVQKSALYTKWESDHDLTHATIKDSIMKGFDAAQHIPPSGEAAVHERVKAVLESSNVPFVDDKVTLWGGGARADFALGFSRSFLTHTAELEPAPTWQRGLTQCLWYKSAYFQESNLQALPMLILFGDVTQERWHQIQTTCLDQRVLLATFDLFIDGEPAPYDLKKMLDLERDVAGIRQGSLFSDGVG